MLGTCTGVNKQIDRALPGVDALFASITNTSVVLPVNAQNSVIDYTGASTTFRFFKGNTEQNVDASNVIVTPASGGDATYTVLNEVGDLGVVVTVTNIVDGVASVQLTITYDFSGTDYDKVFSLSKGVSSGNPIYALADSDVTVVTHFTNGFPSVVDFEYPLKKVTVPADTLTVDGDLLVINGYFSGDVLNPGNSDRENRIGIRINGVLAYFASVNLFVQDGVIILLRATIDYQNKVLDVHSFQNFLVSPTFFVPNSMSGDYNSRRNALLIDFSSDVVVEFVTIYETFDLTKSIKLLYSSIEIMKNQNEI